MNQKKKMTAALAAVSAYIKSSQEAQMAAIPQAAQPAQPVAQTITIEKIVGSVNTWGLSGRQAQMQNRTLLQMKSFHGAKLR